MARSFGRIFASIWDDDDIRALTDSERVMYVFLVTQTDLDHAGVIPLRERRWGRDLDRPVPEVTQAIKGLAAGRFVVVDEDTEELLVRSLIRRDDVWRQPNVFKSAAASAMAVKSTAIRAAILAEVRRLELDGSSQEIRRIRDGLVAALEPLGNPSPTPPERSSEPSVGHPPDLPVDNETGDTGHTGNAAGQNPSGTLTEPPAMGTSEPRGKGSGYGPVPLDSPSPFPHPLPPQRRSRATQPTGTPLMNLAATPGGGESSLDQPEDPVGTLVAEVRVQRPEWSSPRIRRALAEVSARPWPSARRAMLAVAADRSSEGPWRVTQDGPWWHQPPTPATSSTLPGQPDGHPADCACLGSMWIDDPEHLSKVTRCPGYRPDARRSA